MKSALDIHRELLAAGVEHEMVRLRTAVLSADDLPRALGVEPARCVAVRCYRATGADGRTSLVAVAVRAGDLPAPAALLDALGAVTARPATGAEVNAATEYAAPLVSPLCLPPTVPLLADAALGAAEVVYAPTGESGVAVGLRTRDLLVATGARVTNLTSQPLSEEHLGWQHGAGLVSAEDHLVVVAARQRTAGRRTG